MLRRSRIWLALAFAAFWAVAPNTTVDWLPARTHVLQFVGGLVLLVVLPLAVGALIDRWWAPALGAAVPLGAMWPSGCELTRGSDFVIRSCPEGLSAYTIEWGAALASLLFFGLLARRLYRRVAASEPNRNAGPVGS